MIKVNWKNKNNNNYEVLKYAVYVKFLGSQDVKMTVLPKLLSM